MAVVIVTTAAAGSAAGGGAAAAGGAAAGGTAAGGAAATGGATATGGTAATGSSGGAALGASSSVPSASMNSSVQAPSAKGLAGKTDLGAKASYGNGSTAGQNMSVSKNDVAAREQYQDKVKKAKKGIDRTKNAADSLAGDDSESEVEDNESVIPTADEIKRSGKSGRLYKKIALCFGVILFLCLATASLVISVPVAAAKKAIDNLIPNDVKFAYILVCGIVEGVGELIDALDDVDEDIFLGTGLSEESFKELLLMSVDTIDDSVYPFQVTYLVETKLEEYKIGDRIVYERKVDENGKVVRDRNGNVIMVPAMEEMKDAYGNIVYEDGKPLMVKKTEPVYGTREKKIETTVYYALDMADYTEDFFVPWELTYALCATSEVLKGKFFYGNDEAKNFIEDGLIKSVFEELKSKFEYRTDYGAVYRKQIGRYLQGVSLSGNSSGNINSAPIDYGMLRTLDHRIIADCEEGYYPNVVVTSIESYLCDYPITLEMDEYGDPLMVKYTVGEGILDTTRMDAVLERLGINSISKKKYVIEMLIALKRDDLAQEFNDAYGLNMNIEAMIAARKEKVALMEK